MATAPRAPMPQRRVGALKAAEVEGSRPPPRPDHSPKAEASGTMADPVLADALSRCAAHHLRDGEWLALAEDVTVNGAFASIAAHVERIGHLPAWYPPETDAAVRAAAGILAGAAPLALAA